MKAPTNFFLVLAVALAFLAGLSAGVRETDEQREAAAHVEKLRKYLDGKVIASSPTLPCPSPIDETVDTPSVNPPKGQNVQWGETWRERVFGGESP